MSDHLRISLRTLAAVAAITGFASSLAAPASAALNSNGFQMNGFQLQGFQMNGFQLNSLGGNGIQINGLNGAGNGGTTVDRGDAFDFGSVTITGVTPSPAAQR